MVSRRNAKRPQRVYFIQCNGNSGPIKIGIAVDPNRRLSELRIGCPYPMTLLADFPAEDADLDERRLHSAFSHLRIHGEWFTCATELMNAVALARIDAYKTAQLIAGLAGESQATVRRALVPRTPKAPK